MTPAEALLVDVTARAWLARDEALTGTIDDALLEVMPQAFRPGFATGHAPTALPFFIHEPTWLGFFLVFGERVEVGLSQPEADAVASPQDEDGWPPLPFATPCATVDLAPFLVSERLLDHTWAERLGVWDAVITGDPERVEEALAPYGLRLPNEAELFACWRLERWAGWHESPAGLWTGVASALTPPDVAPPQTHWVQWEQGGRYVGPYWPERRVLPGRKHQRLDVRPVRSLLPDELAYSDAAVAARARLPVLRFEAT